MTTTADQIEQLLQGHDCTWEHHPGLPLRSIDLIASVTNQSRFEPIHSDTVDRYVAALETGATFPPIVVRQVPAGTKTQLIILGGNHRARAHIDAGRKTIDAYLVTCDDLVALEIAYADNATHGLPPTEAEQLAHALVLIDRGRTITNAATTVGISHHKIRRRLSAHQTEQAAAKAGVAAEFATLPESTRASLASVKDSRVLAKLVRTITTCRIGSGPPTTRLIGDVNAQADIASQMDYIAAYVSQLSDRPPARTVGRPPTNPYLQLLTALGTIRGLNPSDTIERCTSRRDRQELHDRLLAGARHLMAIDKLLQADQDTTGKPHLEVV